MDEIFAGRIDIRMITKIRLFYLIVRQLGLNWLLYRIYYSLALKLGLLRRQCPSGNWDEISRLRLKNGNVAHWSDYELSVTEERLSTVGASLRGESRVILNAEEILRGQFCLFAYHKSDVGFPPRWDQNPFTGEVIESDRHWSLIDDFSKGDVKCVWELSRFDWAFPLIRAFARTKEIKYFDGFSLLLEDWMRCNPPNVGPQWKCGQEVALRVRVLYFASIGFMQQLLDDDKAKSQLADLMAVSAARIEKNLSYALSQNSNHVHTELLGLLIAGLTFSSSRMGNRWVKLFEKHIRKAVTELNFESGGCCMYSMNYHRMMLDCMVMMVSVARNFNYSLPEILHERLGQAADLLYELMDFTNGQVPRFGSNDGAYLLPLSDAEYHDFRPLLQSLFWATSDQRSLGRGAWNEALIWLGATQKELMQHEVVSCPKQQEFLDASDSGFISIRKGDLQMCVRAGPQKCRPGHLNQLALLLKWKGQDVFVDPGTYSYNAPAPFDHLFKETSLQNTAFVDKFSQMKKVSRFLSLPWLGSNITSSSANSVKLKFEGFPEIAGGVEHSRSIVWSDDGVVVEDLIESKVNATHGIHWLLPHFKGKEIGNGCFRFWDSNIEVQITVEGPDGSEVKYICESANGRWGYRSRYYNQVEPAISIVGVAEQARCSRFKTVIKLFTPSVK